MFGQPGTLGNQLSRRVILLSLITILGLFTISILGLIWGLDRTVNQLTEAGWGVTDTFDRFLLNIESSLITTSDLLQLSDKPVDVLCATLHHHPAVFELILVSEEGDAIYSRRRVGRSDTTSFDQQPWLEAARGGETYIGPISLEEYGVPFIDMAVPIVDENDDFVGTLVARLDLTALWNIVAQLRVGDGGYVYIVDESSQVIVYRDIGLVASSLTAPFRQAGHTPQTLGEAEFTIYRGMDDSPVVGAGVPLERTGWFIIIEQPIGESLSPFFKILIGTTFAQALVFVIVIRAILFTQASVVRPLLILHEGVNALSKGDLSTRITIPNLQGEEMEALTGAFNAMATQLEASITDLQESEERFRALVERAPEAILVIDGKTGKLLQVNRNALLLSGCSRDDLIGQDWLRISAAIQPGGYTAAEKGERLFQAALAGEAPASEWTILSTNGREIPSELRLAYLPGGILRASIIDISERKRIARELHDAVSQTLWSGSLIAEVLPELWERDVEEGQRRLEELHWLLLNALSEIRTLLLELQPSRLIETGLGELLRELARAIGGRTDLPTTVTTEGYCIIPPDAQIALYRIAQEALTNAARHAKATKAEITLNCSDEIVELRIADNGIGFDMKATKVNLTHFGIANMHERAESINANFQIVVSPGEGTEVVVTWLPDG